MLQTIAAHFQTSVGCLSGISNAKLADATRPAIVTIANQNRVQKKIFLTSRCSPRVALTPENSAAPPTSRDTAGPGVLASRWLR